MRENEPVVYLPGVNRPAEPAETSPPMNPSAFDEQFGISLGGRRYFFNIRIGSEQRSKDRLTQEGQVRVSGLAFLYCVICTGAIMLFGTLCLLYLLKSGMGIDMTAGHSVLHPLFSLTNGQ